MVTRLSKSQVAGYAEQGFLSPCRVMQATEASWYREAAYRMAVDDTASGASRFAHLNLLWAYKLALRPNILDIVESLLGPEIIVWGTLIVNKQPQTSTYISWHQDSYYLAADILSLSAWIALSDSNSENGCMRVLPGSHCQRMPHVEIPNAENMLRQGQQIATVVAEDDARDLVLKAGEMSLHHINLIHSSNSNRSDAERLGFVIRYSTPQMAAVPYPVIRARGSASCDHLRFATAPPETQVSAARAPGR